MLHGLVAFLIFALIVVVVAWCIRLYIIRLIPGLPGPAPQIATLIVAIIALLLILDRGLPLFGFGGVM